MTTKLRRWTDAEDGVVGSTRHLTADEVAAMIGRSRSSVENRRHQLDSGWTPVISPWTDDELAIMRERPLLTASQLAELLPGRKAATIASARTRLNIKVAPKHEKRADNIGDRTLLARTCTACGLLLEGKWFRVGKKTISRRAQCVACRRGGQALRRKKHEDKMRAEGSARKKLRAERYSRAQQAMTLPHASRSNYPYVEADLKVLERADMTILQKALALRRTYHAVKQQCTKRGHGSQIGLGDPKDSQWIIDNPNADNIEAISAAIQRHNTQEIPVDRARWDWDDVA